MGAIIVNVLIIVISILLILVVLVQNSKGGGLASNFSASNQIMGVKKTTDFIEKATWSLAIALVVFCIVATTLIPRNNVIETRSYYEDNVPENANFNIPQGIQTSEGMQGE